MTKRLTFNLLTAVYIAIICFLAVRPRIPYLYENTIPGSDIGGFNMYPYFLEEHIDCFVVTETKDSIAIDWKQHLYHSIFASSAHPNFSRDIGDKFMVFLMQNNPQVLQLKDNRTRGTLHLGITLVKEKTDTTTYNYSKAF